MAERASVSPAIYEMVSFGDGVLNAHINRCLSPWSWADI
jgi:hypothetical protein